MKLNPMYNRKSYPTFKVICDNLKLMDKHYNTDKRSPLHHDNRCECVAKIPR